MVCTKLSDQRDRARDYTEAEICGMYNIKSHCPQLCNEQKAMSHA